jgi:hypothetical protein
MLANEISIPIPFWAIVAFGTVMLMVLIVLAVWIIFRGNSN